MNPKTSQDLFNKIRSQFSNIRLGDADGAATADPQDAVFFEFEFREGIFCFLSIKKLQSVSGKCCSEYARDSVNL